MHDERLVPNLTNVKIVGIVLVFVYNIAHEEPKERKGIYSWELGRLMAYLSFHSTSLISYLTVKSYPCNLQRGFISAVLTVVYITLHAEVKSVLDEVYNATNSLETEYPKALFIVASDFNLANIKNVKLWMNWEIHSLLKSRSEAFKSGIPAMTFATPSGTLRGNIKLSLRPRITHVDTCHFKMKKLVIDFRKQSGGHAPVCINDAEVETVKSVKF
eukprot:g42770.t1